MRNEEKRIVQTKDSLSLVKDIEQDKELQTIKDLNKFGSFYPWIKYVQTKFKDYLQPYNVYNVSNTKCQAVSYALANVIIQNIHHFVTNTLSIDIDSIEEMQMSIGTQLSKRIYNVLCSFRPDYYRDNELRTYDETTIDKYYKIVVLSIAQDTEIINIIIDYLNSKLEYNRYINKSYELDKDNTNTQPNLYESYFNGIQNTVLATLLAEKQEVAIKDIYYNINSFIHLLRKED